MQAQAELKITQGKENMTKSGKIFTIYQLLQQVTGFTGVDGTYRQFEPTETFVVRRGQRGVMSVELELGNGATLPLGLGEDKTFLGVVDPIIANTQLMNWTRVIIEEQVKEPAAMADTVNTQAIEMLCGDGPVETEWSNGEIKARLIFDCPADLQTLGEYRKDEGFSSRVFGCIGHNIESLREPNGFELEFDVFLDFATEVAGEAHVLVHGEPSTVFRLDLDAKDMFAVNRFTVEEAAERFHDERSVHVSMLHVERLTPNRHVEPVRIQTEVASADYVPHSQQEGAEIEELLGTTGLSKIIGGILSNDVSPMARKWLSGYVVRVITAPANYADKIVVERLNARETAEGRGDVYMVGNKGEISLDRHRVRFEEFEGPMFSLENITFPEHTATGRDRIVGRGQSRDDRGSRGGRNALPSGYASGLDTPRRAEPERPAKIPTREWIPQMNQCVYIEDDPKKEMYYIADYDQSEHKFLLIPADSLRRERLARQMPSGSKDQTLHNLNGQIPVEPGRLRPFVLFH